jgi:hypothetical protein
MGLKGICCSVQFPQVSWQSIEQLRSLYLERFVSQSFDCHDQAGEGRQRAWAITSLNTGVVRLEVGPGRASFQAVESLWVH